MESRFFWYKSYGLSKSDLKFNFFFCKLIFETKWFLFLFIFFVSQNKFSSGDFQLELRESKQRLCPDSFCPTGYTNAVMSKGCECKSVCNNYANCPYGEVWDYVECSCVNDPIAYPYLEAPRCSSFNCQRGYRFDYRLCRCVIYPEDPNYCNISCISTFQVANYESCECDLKPGCGLLLACPSGEFYDFVKCACKPFSVGSYSSYSSPAQCSQYCPPGFRFHRDLCKCEPICQKRVCARGYKWDIFLCRCLPICEVVYKCPKKMTWSFDTCGCEAELELPEDCAPWHIYNEITLECKCPRRSLLSMFEVQKILHNSLPLSFDSRRFFLWMSGKTMQEKLSSRFRF
jgi:hypothetical protein